MTSKVLLVLLGGSMGALARYGTSLLAVRWLGVGFPWGTLAVNLIGCFLIGLAFSLAERTSFMGPSARLFFVTGFLGALTTFSAYAQETVNAFRAGTHLVTAANILLNNVAGLALVMVGMWVGRMKWGG
jgi:fluoride exporter